MPPDCLAPRREPVSRNLSHRLKRRSRLIVIVDPGHPAPPHCPCQSPGARPRGWPHTTSTTGVHSLAQRERRKSAKRSLKIEAGSEDTPPKAVFTLVVRYQAHSCV